MVRGIPDRGIPPLLKPRGIRNRGIPALLREKRGEVSKFLGVYQQSLRRKRPEGAKNFRGIPVVTEGKTRRRREFF